MLSKSPPIAQPELTRLANFTRDNEVSGKSDHRPNPGWQRTWAEQLPSGQADTRVDAVPAASAGNPPSNNNRENGSLESQRRLSPARWRGSRKQRR